MVGHTSSHNRTAECRINKTKLIASGSKVNTITVRRELHEMGFHCRAATHKPKTTMRNTNCWLEWCKARHHWTLEQWKHVLCQSDRIWVWRMQTLLTPMHSANCKIWRRRNTGLGLFFMVGARLLRSSGGNILTLQRTMTF